jgi:hypothetical protein
MTDEHKLNTPMFPATDDNTRRAFISPSCSPEFWSVDWSVRYDEGAQAWGVFLGGIRRALVPLLGARPYRAGASRLEGVECSQTGGWLVAEGRVRLEGDAPVTILVRDVVRCADGCLELHRSWRHTASAPVSGVEFAIEVRPDGVPEEHLVPGCLYDGNVQADAGRLVPRLQGTALFEEHKCPTPMAYVRCCGSDGRRFGISLIPEPCEVADGNVPDQWWSLGLRAEGAGITLLSVSGRLVVNGEDERIYDAQNRVSPYPDAWVNARPWHVYEKHVRLALQAHPEPVWSWREPLRAVVAAQPPLTGPEEADLSAAALEEAIRLKVGYALNRWYDDGECVGMLWYPNRPEYAQARRSVEYGWVGQNMRLGLSLWRWGRRTGDADLCRRGERCAEVWVRAARAALAAGRVAPTHYIVGQGWRDTNGGEDGYSRPTMETLFELALFCRQERAAGTPRADWESLLFEALAFYADSVRFDRGGLLPLRWDAHGAPIPGPTVTAGVLLAAAMAEAAGLPGGGHWLDRGGEIWERYAAVFLGPVSHHPSGSALDSCCEDMESGMFLLMTALRLAEARRAAGRPANPALVEQAARAADWVLTWCYTWNVPLRPGSLLGTTRLATRGWSDVSVQNRCCHVYTSAALLNACATGFLTAGMSDVSVQNRHLHVYAANAEFMRLAGAGGDEAGEIYRQQARRMLLPMVRTIARPHCRAGMDEDGEQTEQYNQTNYIQHPWDPACRPRGGIGRWFVPWITVWVLSVCLDFLDDDATDKHQGKDNS